LRQAISESGHQALANAPFNAMMAPVERFRAELETAVNAAWRAYAVSRKPAIDRQVLEVLRRLRGFAVTADRIEKLLDQIDVAADLQPQTADDIVTLNNYVASAERAWRELGGESVPPAVLAFLHDAGTRGALLEQLTGDVRQWLDAHNLLSRIRVHLIRESMSGGRA
jgi:hypothetical protein